MQGHDSVLGLDAKQADDVEGVVPSEREGFGLDSFLLVLADVVWEGEETGLREDHVVVVHLVGQGAHAGLDLVGGVFVGHEGGRI